MPELAEVELARRIWNGAEGQKVEEVHSHPAARIFRSTPARALSILENTRITGSARHGKRMFFTFDDQWYLEVHLGMSGKVYLAEKNYTSQKHDHLILRMESCSLVLNDYRMFGKVELHEEKVWENLPPDPISPKFNKSLVKRMVENRPNKVLKGALLAQELFPGVGNWMADEICWRMGVHPVTPLSKTSPESLYEHTKFVCKAAIKYVSDKNLAKGKPMEDLGFKAGGYVDEVPPKSWLFQHRWKKGGVCPKCKSLLERDTIATRTTAWCAQCQPIDGLV